MSRRLLAVSAVFIVTAGLCVPAASASRFLQHGIFDDAQILYGNPDKTFPMLATLKTKLVRVNLVWGGTNGVAKRRPANPTNPNDRAYDWSAYDRTVNYAAQYGMKVVFSIIGTPPWANSAAGVNVAPRNMRDLQHFATAAARRYGGRFRAPDGRGLPAVRHWIAWNEPNNPAFLRPQYKRVAREVGRPERGRLREDVQRDLPGHLGDDARRLEGRLRRDRAARQQQPELLSPRALSARVPAGDEEGRSDPVRRVRPPSRTTARRARRRRRLLRPGSTATTRPRSRSET